MRVPYSAHIGSHPRINCSQIQARGIIERYRSLPPPSTRGRRGDSLGFDSKNAFLPGLSVIQRSIEPEAEGVGFDAIIAGAGQVRAPLLIGSPSADPHLAIA